MGLFNLLGLLLELYSLVIFARVLITWVPNLDPYHPAVRFLHQVTDPVLEPARKLIPPLGMVDISPIIVMIVLQFLASALMNQR
ncbi:MAG TPA: YggT family protein [Caldilineaceae bacterium]|nr:YggT family protein [Caldilineaceae bacterium]